MPVKGTFPFNSLMPSKELIENLERSLQKGGILVNIELIYEGPELNAYEITAGTTDNLVDVGIAVGTILTLFNQQNNIK